MGLFSYVFVGDIERSHLQRDAESTLTHIQFQIAAELQEHKLTLQNLAGTIRSMIKRDSDLNNIKERINNAAEEIIKDTSYVRNLLAIYGIFNVFNGEFHSSSAHLNDNISVESPWYKAAIEAKGRVVVAEPHFDAALGASVITYAVGIFDDKDEVLAVICLDAKLDEEKIIKAQIVDGGFGMLLNSKLEILMHQNLKFRGLFLRDIPAGVFKEDLELGAKIFERQFINYKHEESVAFYKSIENDWFIGIITPKSQYYKSMNLMLKILLIIGFGLSLIISIILIRIIRINERATFRIEQLRMEAENANNAKSAFLAKMSHEIRTPMNVILGVTEIQLQEEAISPSIRESYMMIYNSGNLLLGIINDILDLSKIEAGKMELVPAKYELASLINDTVQLNIMRNKSKQIKFELDIDENVPLELIGDEIRIKQILNNLLSNAFKYTDKGEVKLLISADKGEGDDNAVLIFEISDTGQGMTQEQAGKLFVTEYIRFNLEANRTVEGTGLGINITHHLVQMMNGTISVDSELGKGTKFTVRLPQKKIDSRVLGKEQTESLMQLRIQDSSRSKRVQFVREYMPYGNVLIVDDVETNLHVTRGLMAPYGLSIELVSSGYEAIEKVKNGKVYDIIFMDHMMPGMDGIEATKIIRELGYAQPIVALTANALIGQVKVFLENGFNDFVSKPIDIRQLNNILNKLIRDKQTPEVIAEARKQRSEKAKYAQVMQAADAALHTIFVRDAKSALQIFESTLENLAGASDEDLHLYAVKAHAIKGALANIGEMTLSQMAFTLEKAGKERNRNIIEHKTQGLIDALESIIERSESEKKSIDKEEDSDYLRGQLRTISEACANYDVDTANDALTNLSKMSWTNETKELLEQIAGHLLHSDFEEAGLLAKDRIGL
ncbi:MAG: response regulator [Candidatus Fibromonas sp.]|jgi:signal transduction histidine kinase|nr:response regulator [Candidatus Fibromonas sp.]